MLHFGYFESVNLYAIVKNSPDGKFYTGAGFESYNPANWDDYAIPMTEQGNSKHYTAPFDFIDIYEVFVYQQLGDDPSINDIMVGAGTTDVEPLRLMLSSIVARLQGADTDTITIRDLADTKDRIVANVDEFGNRHSVVVDPI